MKALDTLEFCKLVFKRKASFWRFMLYVIFIIHAYVLTSLLFFAVIDSFGSHLPPLLSLLLRSVPHLNLSFFCSFLSSQPDHKKRG